MPPRTLPLFYKEVCGAGGRGETNSGEDNQRLGRKMKDSWPPHILPCFCKEAWGAFKGPFIFLPRFLLEAQEGPAYFHQQQGELPKP